MFFNSSIEVSLKLNTTEDNSLNIFESAVVNILLKVLYSLVILSAVTANGLVLYLLTTRRIKSSNFTYLLHHLLIADICSCISVLPYVFIDVHRLHITGKITGNILCWSTLGLSMFYATAGNQIFFVCFISVFRLFKMKWKTIADRYLKKSNIKKLAAFAWIGSLLLTIPNMISWKFLTNYGYCKRNWSRPLFGTLYTCSFFVIGLLIPSVLFIVCYFLISQVLKQHRNETNIKQSRTLQSTSKIIYLLRVLFISFLICWAPLLTYFVLATATSLFPEGVKGDRIKLKVIRVAVLLAVVNTLLDPLCLFFHLKEHRSAVKKLWTDRRRHTKWISVSYTTVLTIFWFTHKRIWSYIIASPNM